MENPWLHLPANQPFVLDGEHEAILQFNQSADDRHKVHLELLPEPFLGNPNASVVLLNLNPGYNPRAIKYHQNDDRFIGALRNNLAHATQDYRFCLLDPADPDAPGHKWWRKHLRRLIEALTLRTVANGVLCIEFFPYHSRRYRRLGQILPSQEYSFHLVREAIGRRARIVVMRGERRWLAHVPELRESGYLSVRNPQTPAISKKNLPDGFDEIVSALRTAAPHC